MNNLTPQQVNELANYFSAISSKIGDYRIQQFSHLTPQQNEEIKEKQNLILNYADEMYTLSATLILDDVKTSLQAISNVSNQIIGTYKSLKNIQKAIDVATSVVTLGAAITSKNPQAITNSVSNLVAIWSEK